MVFRGYVGLYIYIYTGVLQALDWDRGFGD